MWESIVVIIKQDITKIRSNILFSFPLKLPFEVCRYYVQTIMIASLVGTERVHIF